MDCDKRQLPAAAPLQEDETAGIVALKKSEAHRSVHNSEARLSAKVVRAHSLLRLTLLIGHRIERKGLGHNLL